MGMEVSRKRTSMVDETAPVVLTVAFAVLFCGATGMTVMPLVSSAPSYCCIPTNASNPLGHVPVAAVAVAGLGLLIVSPAVGSHEAAPISDALETTGPTLYALRC